MPNDGAKSIDQRLVQSAQRDASEEEVSYSDEEDELGEEEEEELRSQLLDVSVTEEQPPGFPPLTKQQLSQFRDALNVSTIPLLPPSASAQRPPQY